MRGVERRKGGGVDRGGGGGGGEGEGRGKGGGGESRRGVEKGERVLGRNNERRTVIDKDRS